MRVERGDHRSTFEDQPIVRIVCNLDDGRCASKRSGHRFIGQEVGRLELMDHRSELPWIAPETPHSDPKVLVDFHDVGTVRAGPIAREDRTRAAPWDAVAEGPELKDSGIRMRESRNRVCKELRGVMPSDVPEVEDRIGRVGQDRGGSGPTRLVDLIPHAMLARLRELHGHVVKRGWTRIEESPFDRGIANEATKVLGIATRQEPADPEAALERGKAHHLRATKLPVPASPRTAKTTVTSVWAMPTACVMSVVRTTMPLTKSRCTGIV